MLGYAAYADRFAGTLPGVADQIPYLEELGVTYLHLMPLLRPRDGDNDGGYAVADYRTVRPDLGTIGRPARARAARCAARESASSSTSCSTMSPASTTGPSPRAPATRATARTSTSTPTAREPDAYERTLPEVFPEFAPGNFTWDDELGGWVWTTFNEFQWDLDWATRTCSPSSPTSCCSSPTLGVEVLRLDAIAFLWKRLGTSCQNQPEVHAITQALRALLRIAAPATVLKAEAIVGPDDLAHYLGTGRHHGKVSDLAYHNSLMVQVWSMLAARDVRLAVHALQATPASSRPTTAWITYLRCHDDIGWAIDDADAAAVGLSGPAHRAFLSDYYTGRFPGSSARGPGVPGQPGHRRPAGERHRRPRSPDWTPRRPTTRPRWTPRSRRILLAHAIVLGWGGIPVLWMGDELGLPNDARWADEPGHEDDNRWVHRPRMDRGGAGRARRPRLGVRAGCSPACGSCPRPRARCRTCTRRSRRSCSTRPIPACLPCCTVTRRATCSSSTTSPTRGARGRRRGSAAAPCATRSPARTGRRDADGNVWLAPYRRAVARPVLTATAEPHRSTAAMRNTTPPNPSRC